MFIASSASAINAFLSGSQDLLVTADENCVIVYNSVAMQVLDPKSGKATRVGRKANSEGKLVRYSKKSGEEIK